MNDTKSSLPILGAHFSGTPAAEPTGASRMGGCGSMGGTIPLAKDSQSKLFESSRRLPSWLRREVPKGNGNQFTHGLLKELRLETVCENAKCPN
ncbi:MAG: hypothetical protein ACK480_16460, partial [Planctomycetota bacterium]